MITFLDITRLEALRTEQARIVAALAESPTSAHKFF
jgi:hypothetical protein